MDKIFLQLQELKDNALIPYSHYGVASILETDQGLFNGVNVELDVMNLGICAERNAVFNALTHKMRYIKHIYLLTDSQHDFGTPCGGCRQVLSQFADNNTLITFFNLKGDHKTEKFLDLLPKSWSKKDLGK